MSLASPSASVGTEHTSTTGTIISLIGNLVALDEVHLGGNNITNDLSYCFNITREEAEQLKQGRKYFTAVKNKSKEFIIIII